MNRIGAIMLSLMLTGCSIVPQVIPDTTGDSPMELKIKHDMQNPPPPQSEYGWLAWYIPILLIGGAWTWREFFGKKPVKRQTAPKKTKKRK